MHWHSRNWSRWGSLCKRNGYRFWGRQWWSGRFLNRQQGTLWRRTYRDSEPCSNVGHRVKRRYLPRELSWSLHAQTVNNHSPIKSVETTRLWSSLFRRLESIHGKLYFRRAYVKEVAILRWLSFSSNFWPSKSNWIYNRAFDAARLKERHLQFTEVHYTRD